MNSPLSVGLGERIISQDANDVLVAYGLGSCLAISMVDPVRKVSGLIHSVLPERMENAEPYSPKYVDSGIEGLLKEMIKAGADPRRIVLRMAGGANMLLQSDKGSTFDIGSRNIAAAHKAIQRLNLKLSAAQVGGNTGRTVRLYIADGRMTVRMIGGKEQEL